MSWLVVDVSKFNTFTDYTAAAASVDGVLIRCGIRGYGSAGTLSKDAKLDTHYNGFHSKTSLNGEPIKIGYYWFPNAISDAEAIAEANYVAQLLAGRQNDFPVYYDSEIADTTSHSGRADNLSRDERTHYAQVWGNRMRELGFRVGVYASEYWFENNIDYLTLLNDGWSIWIAKYSSSSPSQDSYDAWQYTSSGILNGASARVDLSNFYTDVAGWENTQIDINNLNIWVNSPITYDGNDQVIPLCGIDGLTLGVDYLVSFSDCNNVTNKAKAIFNGINGYTGTKTINYTITQASVDSVGITLASNTYPYTGSAITPALVIDKSTPLGKKFVSAQYNIGYSSNVNPGIATITITGKNNYTGTRYIYFTISGVVPFPSTPTIPETSYTYTGSEITPTVTIEGLTENEDFTVAYTNNINIGIANITITGINEYAGEEYSLSFMILQKDFSDSVSIQFTNGNKFPYTGSPITPSFVVKDNNKVLTAGTDYSYTFANNTNVGECTLTIVGANNYTGTKKANFYIIGTEITDADINIPKDTYEYTGNPIVPEVTVTLGDVVLVKDTDYTVAYRNNIDIGPAFITVTGKGNYSSSKTINFTIISKKLPTDWVLDHEQYNYDGSYHNPRPSSEEGADLVDGVDYDVTYSDNVNIGTATCKIIGKNNYYGDTVTLYFYINASNLDGDSFSLVETEYIYTKQAIKPEVICTGSYRRNIDYTITYHDNILPQSTSVIITGKGNYKGTISLPYIINKIDLTKLGEIYMGEPDEDGIYDPDKFAVMANGLTLVMYDDYIYDFKTITFPVNSSYQHTVYIVAGIGPCEGTITRSYLTRRPGYTPDVPHYKPRDTELIDDEISEDTIDKSIKSAEDLLKYADDQQFDYGNTDIKKYVIVAESHSFGNEDYYMTYGSYIEDPTQSSIEMEIGYEEGADYDFNELCLIETDIHIDPIPDDDDEDDIDGSEFIDVEPTPEADPEDSSYIMYPSGTILSLRNVRYFSSPYNIYPEPERMTGNYYVYNWRVVNGKIRVTNLATSVKVAGRTTGWVELDSIVEVYSLKVGDRVKILKYIYSDYRDTTQGLINREGEYMYITDLVSTPAFNFGDLDNLDEEVDETDGYEFGDEDDIYESTLVEMEDIDSEEKSEDETDEGYDFNILSTVATDIGPRIGVADRPSQTTLGWVSLDMIIYE